jgi:hypothetical protein
VSHVYKKIKVEKFEIEAESKKRVKKPFIRITLDDGGCPLPNCSCSPDNYISISNGEVGLTVGLKPSQVKQLVEHGTLWLDETEGVGRNELEKVFENFDSDE